MGLQLVDVKKLLEDRGILLQNDHFAYTSGGHGSAYVNKDAICADVDLLSHISRRIAFNFLPAANHALMLSLDLHLER